MLTTLNPAHLVAALRGERNTPATVAGVSPYRGLPLAAAAYRAEQERKARELRWPEIENTPPKAEEAATAADQPVADTSAPPEHASASTAPSA